MEYKYNAIILGKQDVGETDRIYTAYTLEAGKVRLLAKGVRRPNARLAGNLETLTAAGVFIAKSRGRGNIIGVVAEENFENLKGNIDYLEKVFATIKIFNRLITQEEKDEAIYSRLLSFLAEMDRLAGKKEDLGKADVIVAGFLFGLLGNLGYEIQAKKCVVCGKKLERGENFFGAQRGGIICGLCSRQEMKKVKISDEAIKLIRIFLENKLENFKKIKVEKKSLDNLKIILNESIGWIIG